MHHTRIILMAAAVLAATPAFAATYDVAADFGSSVFGYGYGTGNNVAGTLSNSFANCYGAAGFDCRTAGGSTDLPAIGKNSGASAANFITVSVPAGGVFLHPGSAAGQDAILSFTAPTAGRYSFSGSFARLDTTANGDGTIVSVLGAGASPLFTSTLAPNATSPVGFSGAATLAAGDRLFFVVNRNGEYTYDSTGLSASITAVPEPATWAMMILGFGLVGATLRRRVAATA